MALNAYMTIRGQRQGQINGSVTQKGREHSILVIAMNHEVVSPRDPESGQPTGKRQHRPLTVLKEVDKSSPLLWTSLANNENLTEVIIKFFAPRVGAAAGGGAETHHYTIRLTNASIASMRMEMLNTKHPDTQRFAEREFLTFTYQRIEWTFVDGGISAVDDFEGSE